MAPLGTERLLGRSQAWLQEAGLEGGPQTWEVSPGREGQRLTGCRPLCIRPRATLRGGCPGQGLAGIWANTGALDALEVRQVQKRGGAGCVESCSKDRCFFSVPLLVADVSDIGRFLHAFHKPQAGLIQAARQLLSGEQAPLRQKLLADLLHTVSENTEAETRAEDPPWFEGTAGPEREGLSGAGCAGEARAHCCSRAPGLPGVFAPVALGPAPLFICRLWESICDITCST